MMDNHTEEGVTNTYQDESAFVEMATLILPSHAAGGGMESGEGEEVVLEASQETVDNLGSNNAQCHISAIVDLEMLSELVGISEEEFIADLHMDVNDNRQFEGDVADDGSISRLSVRSDATGTAKTNGDEEEANFKGTEGEETPLLGNNAPEETHTASDRITLTADPFIETLADVLPTIAEDERYNGPDISEGGVVSADYTTNLAGDRGEGDMLVEAGATKTDDDQHLAHDAFLLNIPNENSATGDMEDHFVLALPEIRLEASVAASSISHASVEDLDASQLPFIERAMSFLPEIDDMRLPTDVVNVQLEAHTHTPTKEDPTDLHLDLVVKRRVPMIGYVILISGLFALASVGAALDMQHGPSPTMKTLWRQLATCAVLSPLVAKSFYTDGFPELTRDQWLSLPLCGAAYAYMCLAFVAALELTTMANAFVLSNMTSLVIIVGRFVLGLPVLPSEGMGAFLGFVGAAICANDASKTLATMAASQEGGDDTGGTAKSAMMGNVVALSASFGTATYLIFAKRLRSSLDIFVFMFSVMFLGSLCLMIYMTIVGEAYTLGMDIDIGLFGWLHLGFDRLPLEMFMAIVCNCMGTTGYIAVMKYFEPIVPASVMLMEPVVGSLLGTLSGATALPGMQTWMGDAVVAAGTFLVIWSGAKKTEKIEATDALRPSTGDDSSTVATLLKSPAASTSSRKKPFPSSPSKSDGPAPARVVWDS